MDPNTVVLEISSDEDVGWNDNNGRGIADGGDEWVVDHKLRAVGSLWLSGIAGSIAYNWSQPGMKTSVRIIHASDDHDWLAELLDEVNKGNFGDDTDEVVVVSEVSPSEKTGKKSKLKPSLLDLDDDCVILDKDPEKPVEVLNDKPSNVEDDSDMI